MTDIYNKNLLNPVEKAGPGEEFDYEGYMIQIQLRRMQDQAAQLLTMIKEDEQFPSWIQSKVTLASEYMDGVYDFYKYSDYTITSSMESEKENMEESDDMEDSDED